MSSFDFDKHIEKKIPFMYETKEGEQVVLFPAERRFTTSKVSLVVKDETNFNKELEKIKNTCSNFISSKP